MPIVPSSGPYNVMCLQDEYQLQLIYDTYATMENSS